MGFNIFLTPLLAIFCLLQITKLIPIFKFGELDLILFKVLQ